MKTFGKQSYKVSTHLYPRTGIVETVYTDERGMPASIVAGTPPDMYFLSEEESLNSENENLHILRNSDNNTRDERQAAWKVLQDECSANRSAKRIKRCVRGIEDCVMYTLTTRKNLPYSGDMKAAWREFIKRTRDIFSGQYLVILERHKTRTGLHMHFAAPSVDVLLLDKIWNEVLFKLGLFDKTVGVAAGGLPFPQKSAGNVDKAKNRTHKKLKIANYMSKYITKDGGADCVRFADAKSIKPRRFLAAHFLCRSLGFRLGINAGEQQFVEIDSCDIVHNNRTTFFNFDNVGGVFITRKKHNIGFMKGGKF